MKIDAKHQVKVGGNKESTLNFAARHFIDLAQHCIKEHDAFYVALSGGSTPLALFEKFATIYKKEIDWSKVYFFWSDERSVPPTSDESNFGNAMRYLSKLPIPSAHIFRMHAEENIEENALTYENKIKEIVPHHCFDLIMLGMGPDGHTASLFPNTAALQEHTRLVVANSVPQKNTQRMTFTYPLINHAKNITLYVLGEDKKEMVKQVLRDKAPFPVQKVGTLETPALWILDTAAASLL